ncbi:MAG: D-alanyl-D-alanine carboxypeptidase [Alphaproteobacteria bacterium]|nr:D-alanyl-D-alanine carboxypeptidase [Alphaproteobacteria bacterium]
MKRWLCLLLIAFFATSTTMAPYASAARPQARSAPRTGTSDPRYAAYIVDSVTGEVLHQQNADARRYPASLTKMMTLYLLFDALEKGKVTMNTRMKVSAQAAIQPQTNISLSTRDAVPVETAIRALVIRSANDVAVVVAEHLGGSVDKFAQMATAKARALGMNNTIFKNPHGLPNAQQVTTARDMAKLGIALKRDFPKYYTYFDDKQFSWKGATYYTHNRVIGRFTGADGIKTGFINAAGFNLVTSVERGGRRLVGVVLGGSTGRWRDDRMIALLGQSYRVLAQRGGVSRGVLNASNLPNDLRPPAIAPANQRVTATQYAAVPKDRGIVRAEQQNVQVQVASSVRPQTLQAQLRERQPVANLGAEWGIQVGAFSDRAQAERAAANAMVLAQQSLQGSRIMVVGAGSPAQVVIHRARLENISEDQAKRACQVLISNNSPCFIYRAGAL